MNIAQLENSLETELRKLLPKHSISEAYHWAMLPAGKLFRPGLALAICNDLNPDKYKEVLAGKNKNIIFFAMALECHHSYSLVHDDLPSMDNDDFRRNKESTHKKYGEWKAILVGDGLLNISYEFLSKIKTNHPERLLELIKIFSYALGPRGLIHGQTLDLSTEMISNFECTLLTHKLKTARLIQVSMLGSAYLSVAKNRQLEKKLWKLGEDIGILFQLIDDLSELTEQSISPHELEINPWIRFNEKTISETLKRLNSLQVSLSQLKMHNTNKMLSGYFKKMYNVINADLSNINFNLENKCDLDPVMKALNTLSLLD